MLVLCMVTQVFSHNPSHNLNTVGKCGWAHMGYYFVTWLVMPIMTPAHQYACCEPHQQIYIPISCGLAGARLTLRSRCRRVVKWVQSSCGTFDVYPCKTALSNRIYPGLLHLPRTCRRLPCIFPLTASHTHFPMEKPTKGLSNLQWRRRR